MSHFARTSRGPMGKYDCKLGEMKFYEEARRRLQQKAAKAPGGGIDLTEYIRRHLLVLAYGVEDLTKLHREQYESVQPKSEYPGSGE